jgi:MerR family transcriptional regulator, redox-sensitive transcriptional activator SoxR
VTIGEFARKSGVTASTIRYYEEQGVLPPPPRVSGQRRYDDRDVQRLAIVRFAKHVGFSLSEIKQLLDGATVRPPSERWRKMAHQRLDAIDALLANANTIKRMVLESLSQTCPKLVERGSKLMSDTASGRIVDRHDGRKVFARNHR